MGKKVRLAVILGYSAGNFGYGLISQTLSSYLVFFSTVILKMPGSLIGLIISVSVIWDAVSDPVMGYFSDNTVSRYGKRHPYILIGALFGAAANIMLWSSNGFDSLWGKFIWILTSVLLIKTFMTVFITPYSALGAELSTDYYERSLIQAIKTAFFLIAILLVTAGYMFVFFKPTPEYPIGQLNPRAYRQVAIISSMIMIATGLITYFSTQKHIVEEDTTQKQSGKFQLKEFSKKIKFSIQHKDFRAVFQGYLFTNLAAAIITTIGLHTFTYTFGLDNYKIGIVLGTQFVVCTLAQPIWVKISERIDKNNSVKLGLKISMVGCVILMLFVLFREEVKQNFEYLLVYSLVIGFGTSGLFSLPLSMVADTVDQQEHKTGERNEGIYYGMLTFGYKISQSIAIFLLGILLDLIRFDASLPVQSSMTEILLGACLALGSITAFTFASIAYRQYSLDAKAIEHIQGELGQKNKDYNKYRS